MHPLLYTTIAQKEQHLSGSAVSFSFHIIIRFSLQLKSNGTGFFLPFQGLIQKARSL